MINFIWLVIVFCVGYLIGRYLHIQRDNSDLYEPISSLVDFDDNGKRDVLGLFDRCHELAKRDCARTPMKKYGEDACSVCSREVFYEYNFCPGCGRKINRKGYNWNTCSGDMTKGE